MLYDYIFVVTSSDITFNRYGLNDLSTEFCKENIIAERDMFINGILSLKADMDRKPKDTNSNEQSELFGFDGNFKQLNID